MKHHMRLKDVPFQMIWDGMKTIERRYSTGSEILLYRWIFGYIDVVYPGHHIRNTHNKSDTFTVEGINADLRHYIPILARRSRCFPQKLGTLKSVVEVFVNAYNNWGLSKYKYRQQHKTGELPFSVIDFL